jgi:DNA-binding XRE family transcriptional regulator
MKMRANRRDKLTSKGWKVGSAAEFLGLSPEAEALIELRLRLAHGLRARRTRQRMTQAQLAAAIRSSQSRVAKMEAGDPTVSLDLLVRSLLALGASSADLGKIIAAR